MQISHILSGILIALLSSQLAGCSAVVPLKPGPDANSPECANMMVRLPSEILGQSRRSVNAQSTGAWGNPVSIIVRCGIVSPGPSTLPCLTVDGVDWLRDDTADPNFLFTTFGRTPATEVLVDSRQASGFRALSALAPAINSQSAPIRMCLD